MNPHDHNTGINVTSISRLFDDGDNLSLELWGNIIVKGQPLKDQDRLHCRFTFEHIRQLFGWIKRERPDLLPDIIEGLRKDYLRDTGFLPG